MAERLLDQITLRQVSRAYGRGFALHRVSFSLSAGTITALIGDNGAGKTTLLNILATIDQPTAGSVHFDELPLAIFARRCRHRIGWVSHQSLLYEELTARENLHFYASMYGLDDIPRRAEAWLRRVRLLEAADRRVRNFSRGMKQRLTIARALLPNPRLLLLDEPATGLDQSGVDLLVHLLQDLRQRDRIIVLVTHNFDLVEALANRILILKRGKVALDSPREALASVAEAYQLHGSASSLSATSSARLTE